MQMFGHRKTVTRADRARLADELTEIGLAIGVNERACCCPARPLVRVMLPAAGNRPELVDLLLCGHHYRASQAALCAAGAVVYDEKGELIMDAAPRHRPGRHQAAVAAPPAWLSALWLNSYQLVISVETCHFVCSAVPEDRAVNGRGVVGVVEGSGDASPSGPVVLRPAARRAAEPSWARVLATTVRLSVSWRLRAMGFGPGRTTGRLGRNRFRLRAGHSRRPVAWRWSLPALCLVVALAVVAILRFTGVFAGTAAAVTPVASPGQAGPHGTSSLAAARYRAAAWIGSQVSGNAIIACYPDMCAALQAQGVTAGRLMPLATSAASPRGAGLMVTSPAVPTQLADTYAPALIASFGSGDARIEVRAAEPGGAAAYRAALRADLASRRQAGSQLLKNWRIQFTAQDAARLRAGEVDTRLLATLAALAAQHSFRVTAFGDTSPGAAALFREVTLTSGGADGSASLAKALGIVRAQAPPYLPAHAAIATGPTGQDALSIEFAAPSPLGLLTAVLLSDPQQS